MSYILEANKREKQGLSLRDRLSNIKNIGKNVSRYIPFLGLSFLLGYANNSFAQNNNILTIPKDDFKYEIIKTLGDKTIEEFNFKGKVISCEEFMNEKVLYEIYYKDFNDTLSIEVEDINNNGFFDEGDVLSRKSFFNYNTPYTLTQEGVSVGYSHLNTQLFIMFLEVSRNSIEKGVDKEYIEKWLKENTEILEENMYKNAFEEIENYEQFLR